jgi:hypothetical protein
MGWKFAITGVLLAGRNTQIVALVIQSIAIDVIADFPILILQSKNKSMHKNGAPNVRRLSLLADGIVTSSVFRPPSPPLERFQPFEIRVVNESDLA